MDNLLDFAAGLFFLSGTLFFLSASVWLFIGVIDDLKEMLDRNKDDGN